MKNIDRHFELAEQMATLAAVPKHRTGCVLLDKAGRVLSVGNNSIKSHPVQAEYAERVGRPLKIHLHAEISALIRLNRKERVHAAIVTRLLRNGERSMAKPCPICSAALSDAGVSEIFYTERDGSVKNMLTYV